MSGLSLMVAGAILAAAQALPPYIPALTDEDREAAFPDVPGHSVHDNAVHWFLLFDELEWQNGADEPGLVWDTRGWVGRDIDRFWFRTEGAAAEGAFDHGEVSLLYGRAIGRWWELVGGLRQEVRPGPSRSWAAVGVQGLAPYWFEVEATAFVGSGGQTQLRLEAEYELLLTNRLVLQPLVELNLYGKTEPERGIGAGLAESEAGLRLRYEIRREFAPYVGVSWERRYFGTADAARAAGEHVAGARLVVGLRFWQ